MILENGYYLEKWLIVLAMIMVQMKIFVHFEYINYTFLFKLKLTWFKKLYSSEETKVVFEKLKSENKGDDKKKNTEEQEAVTVGEFKIDESQKAAAKFLERIKYTI